MLYEKFNRNQSFRLKNFINKGIALIRINKANFMLLSYDPDKVSYFKNLLKAIPIYTILNFH